MPWRAESGLALILVDFRRGDTLSVSRISNESGQFSQMFPNLTSSDSTIEEMARRVVQQSQPVGQPFGHRSQQRIPFPKLVALSPLQDDGRTLATETIHVVGRNLATLGFDFYHQEPIPFRFAMVSLPVNAQHFVHFQLKITWCRFLKPRWYDSGGRFVKASESPDSLSSIFPLHGDGLN